jgi:hypothetical protein
LEMSRAMAAPVAARLKTARPRNLYQMSLRDSNKLGFVRQTPAYAIAVK